MPMRARVTTAAQAAEDDQADPRVVAADLLSQAEHDEEAYALLVTLSERQAKAVAAEVETQLDYVRKHKPDSAGLRFISGAMLMDKDKKYDEALALYRHRFRPSAARQEPYAIAALNVFAADTEREAQRLSTSVQQAFVALRSGQPRPLPPPVDTLTLSGADRAMLDGALACTVIGTETQVAEGLARFAERTRADELIVTAQAEASGWLARFKPGRLRRLARHRFPVVEASRYTATLGADSKVSPERTLLQYLFGAGRAEIPVARAA